MKQGAYAVIKDIRHHRQYARTFSEIGCADIRRVGFGVLSVCLMLITFGQLRPATPVVRKNAL